MENTIQMSKRNHEHVAATLLIHDQHQFSLTSADQFYPDSHTTQLVPTPREGESKLRRRRRKRSKAVGASGETSSNEMSIMKKRKLTKEQVNLLELNFGNEHKLESEKKDRLASELGLDPRQVAVWFQNRRARWKNKKLEEEYCKLKSSHDNVVVEKCSLESEVLKLNEEVLKLNEALSEAKKEAETRLSELRSSLTAGSIGIMATSTGSPSSSMSSSLSMVTDHQQQQFPGELEVDEFENFLYSPSYYYNNNYNWVNLYGGF